MGSPHLAVQSVERHRGVGQADHPHAGGGDVRQHRLVPGPPLLLLAPGLPAPALDAPALSVEAWGEAAPQEVLSLKVQRRRPGLKRPDTAEGRTQQQGEQHGT